MKAKLIILLILLVPVGIFVYQNMAEVPIVFINWSIDLPQALLLLGALVLGFLLGMLQMFQRARKKKKMQQAAQQTAQQADAHAPATSQTWQAIDAEVVEPETATTAADSSNLETGAKS